MSVTSNTTPATGSFTGVSSKTWTVNPGTGADYLRISTGYLGYGAGNVAFAATCKHNGGADLTLVKSETYVGLQGTDNGHVAIWEKIAPDIGAYSAVITFGLSQAYGGCVGHSYNGVHQTTPSGTPVSTQTTGTNPTVSITGASGDNMISDALISNVAITATYTEILNVNASGVRAGSQERTSTSGSTSMAWTSANTKYAIAACEILAAAAGGGFAIDGIGGITAVGASVAAGAASGAGTGTMQATALSQAAGAHTSDGAATVEFAGSSTASSGTGDISADGVGAFNATGASLSAAAMDSAGSGDAALSSEAAAGAPAAEIPGQEGALGGAYGWNTIPARRRRQLLRAEDQAFTAALRELAPHILQHSRSLH